MKLAGIAILLALVPIAINAAALPPQLHVPSAYTTEQVRFSQFDSGTFEYPSKGGVHEHAIVEGRRWDIWLKSDARPIVEPGATATSIAGALEKDGWSILRQTPVLIATKGEAWLNGYGNSASFKVLVVEKAPLPRPIALTAPSASAEPLTDDHDFPWFAPFPGAKLKSTRHDDRPFNITAPNARETSFSGPAITKYYDIPNDVSSYEFVTDYRHALESAGWTVVRCWIGSDGAILAHYTAKGRDLWLYTHSIGTGQSVSVADTGAESAAAKLQAELAGAGHIAVYGIYFDVDSSVPRPESAPALQHILELLQKAPSLRLEIQGHTDDSGAAAHNQQLSEARAESIRTWLTGHGIPAGRLTSHGYGATRPVAENKTPEGKARNRRVELVRVP
jgi:outer membrane protein OmpA-like peptidoglycan-associated protein